MTFGRIRLLPELYTHLNPMPLDAAARMEMDLAEDLRRLVTQLRVDNERVLFPPATLATKVPVHFQTA